MRKGGFFFDFCADNRICSEQSERSAWIVRVRHAMRGCNYVAKVPRSKKITANAVIFGASSGTRRKSTTFVIARCLSLFKQASVSLDRQGSPRNAWLQLCCKSPETQKKITANAVIFGASSGTRRKSTTFVIARCLSLFKQASVSLDRQGSPRNAWLQLCCKSPETQKKITANAVIFGASSGTRTLDPLIKSQLLYQLS